MTVGASLERATSRLQRAGVPEPRANAERLLSHLLQVDRGGLLLRRNEALGDEAMERYSSWLERREGREPLQHIVGTQEFHGLELVVDRSVLIPRQETELLVDRVLETCRGRASRVIDLGTGSGCIPVVLARKAEPTPEIVAVERSRQALATARRNARLHAVEEKIEWIHGDFAGLSFAERDRFDVVVSNPPYVREADWEELEPEVRDHDPREALVAGADGLDAYRALVPVAQELLRPGGLLVLELGYDQSEAVSALVRECGLEPEEIRPDLAGIPRVLTARAAERGGER